MQATKERTAEIALCCAPTCVAGAAYADVFAGWQFAFPVVGGAAVPALVVVIATQRGWRPGRAALVGALLLAVAAAALLLVLPGAGVSSVGDAAGTVADGTVDGWAAMLAARTRGPIVPLGPPTAALAASLAPTGDAASNRLALAVAFLGLALVLTLVRANRAVATALTEAPPGAGVPSPEARASSPNAARLHTPAGRVAFGVPLVAGISVASPLAAPTRLPSPTTCRRPRGVPATPPATPPVPARRSRRRSSRPRSTVTARAAGESAPRPPGASPPSWPCSACWPCRLLPSACVAATGAGPTRALSPGCGPMGQLVPLLAEAFYPPFEPDGAAADRAWRLDGDARSSLRRGTGPWRRLRPLLDPRPLLGVDRQARRAGRGRTAPPTAVAPAGDADTPTTAWPRCSRCGVGAGRRAVGMRLGAAERGWRRPRWVADADRRREVARNGDGITAASAHLFSL